MLMNGLQASVFNKGTFVARLMSMVLIAHGYGDRWEILFVTSNGVLINNGSVSFALPDRAEVDLPGMIGTNK